MRKSITVYAVSDQTATTVCRLVRAASAQFPGGDVTIKALSHASSAAQVVDFIEAQGDAGRSCAVFHTILAKGFRKDMRNALQARRIPSIDLLGSAAHLMADLLGERPVETPGLTIDDGAEPMVFDLS